MRIRSIKPEFWRSQDIAALSVEDRLLFIGLWSYVDDNGVGVDDAAIIAADLFAHDLSVSAHDTLMRVQGGLKRLNTAGLIHRYEVGAKRYLHVTTWKSHQRINRPSPGRFPLPDQGKREPQHESGAPLSEGSVSAHCPEQGNRGTGEQGNDDSTVMYVSTDRAREILTDEEKTILGQAHVDPLTWVGSLDAVGIRLRAGRDYVRLAFHLLGKTTDEKQNPTGYLLACLHKNPLEVRTWAVDTDSLEAAS